MPQPTPYDRGYSFALHESEHPSDPPPGNEMDAEFDSVRATLDEVLANMALLQRDDGQLANASVGIDQLTEEVLIGVNAATAWAAGTAYAVSDTVFYLYKLYRCIEAHTSTASFDATKFEVLADFGAIATGTYPDNSVTLAKLQQIATQKLLGRGTAGTGNAEVIGLSASFSITGGNLTLTTGGVLTAHITDANVTLAKLANLANAKLIGRGTAGTGVPEALSVLPGLTLDGNGLKLDIRYSQALKTDTFTTAATAFTDVTGVSVSITPRTTSSKILILCFGVASNATAGSGTALKVTGGALAVVGDAASNRIQSTTGSMNSVASSAAPFCIAVVDTPNSVAAQTYKLQARTLAAGTACIGRTGTDTDTTSFPRFPTGIIAIEIAS